MLKDDEHWYPFQGMVEQNFTGPNLPDPMPAEVRRSFMRFAEEEYQFASAIHNDVDLRIETARKHAFQRAMAKHPPVVWNGQVYMTNQPGVGRTVTDEAFERMIRARFEGSSDEKIQRRIRNLRNEYSPTWSDAHGGFIFIKDNGEQYVGPGFLIGGRMRSTLGGTGMDPIVFKPVQPEDQEGIGEQAREAIEEARRREEETQGNPRTRGRREIRARARR
jgi:hypothetical protein